MTLLALLLPHRPRGGVVVDSPQSRSASGTTAEWVYAFSRDGLMVDASGTSALQSLPEADRVVLVAHEDDVTWLSATLPRTPAGRLKEALQGALEDHLLEEPHLAHLAVARGKPEEGQPTWVAAVHRAWIQQHLEELSQAGLHVQALVGLSEPGPNWRGHVQLDAQGRALAVVCGPEGVSACPLEWPGLRARLPQAITWTVQPAAALALRESLGVQAPLIEPSERMLRAAAQGSNLLQFELAPRMKGSQALWAAWMSFRERRWRAVHVGLAALVIVQVLGLNLAAYRARAELAALDGRSESILRETFPSVKVVVDASVQMEREIQTLRRAAGQAGPTDLDTWIDLVATFWAGQPSPLKSVRLDAAGLTLEADVWPPAALVAVQSHAARHGWQAQQQGSVLQILRPASER